MAEYTPTTDKVREVYEWYMDEYEQGRSSDYKAEFDRWLAAHDREVAARTLEAASEQIEDSGWLIPEEGRMAAGWLTERAAALRSGTEGSTD